MTDGQVANFTCRVFVNEDEVYSGGFEEVPETYRKKIRRDLSEWSDRLGKTGLNELLYSHLSWYESMSTYCRACGEFRDGGAEDACEVCGSSLNMKYVHDRDKNLDMLMTCMGMISRVEVQYD